jgi:hypothetical protein
MPDQNHQKSNECSSIAKHGATALAIGLGLGGFTDADAGSIVYTDLVPDVVIQFPANPYQLDVDNNGVVDFEIGHFTGASNGSTINALAVLPEGSDNAVVLDSPGSPYAAALDFGALIGPNQPFGPGQAPKLMALAKNSTSQTKGPWPGRDAYLGLRFDIAGSPHFGWAHFNVPGDVSQATIFGYAYCDEANTRIAAGQTGGACTVPEPSAVLLLAAGAAGVFAYRRRVRSQEKSS